MKNSWTRSHRVFHLRCMCTTPSVASGKQSLYNKGQSTKERWKKCCWTESRQWEQSYECLHSQTRRARSQEWYI